jgi:hypothetical protein
MSENRARSKRRRRVGPWLAALAATAVVFCAGNARAESGFEFDLRILDGFYATNAHQSAGGLVGGFRLGDSTWFGKDSSFGMLILTGVEGGALFSKHVDGTLVVGGELGAQFLGGHDHKSGSGISVSWAPKMFVNLAGGGEVASPVGVEVAFTFSSVKIPLWFLQTLDGGSFFGGSLSFVF